MVMIVQNSQLPNQDVFSPSINGFSLIHIIFLVSLLSLIIHLMLFLMDFNFYWIIFLQYVIEHQECGSYEVCLRAETDLQYSFDKG